MTDEQERSEWDRPADGSDGLAALIMAGEGAREVIQLNNSIDLLNHRIRVLGDKLESVGDKLDRLAKVVEQS